MTDPAPQAPLMPVDPAPQLTARRKRARAAAAALAAGGLASLSVVLLGAPAVAEGDAHGPQLVITAASPADSVPARRADVTLGEL